jgi:hypothetical protein
MPLTHTFLGILTFESAWDMVVGLMEQGYQIVLNAYQSYGSFEYRYELHKVEWQHIDRMQRLKWKKRFDSLDEERAHFYRTLGEAQGTLYKNHGDEMEPIISVHMIDRRVKSRDAILGRHERTPYYMVKPVETRHVQTE